MIATNPVMKESLLLLNVCGMNPLNYNKWSKFRAVLAMLSLTIFSIEMLLEVVLTPGNLDSVYTTAFMISSYQGLGQILILVLKRKKIVHLLSIMDKFWQLSDIHTPPELKQRIGYTYTAINRVGKRLAVIVTAFMVALFIPTMLLGILPIKLYHADDPRKWVDFKIAWGFEVSVATYALFSYFGSECLFIAFTVYIYCEFQVIKERILLLPRFDDPKVFQELKSIVDQHNIVLGCFHELNSIYSLVMFSHLVLTTLGLSGGMVVAVIRGFAKPLELLLITVFLMGLSGQLFVYCLGGTILTMACEDVASAVLESDWWLIKEPQCRKCLILVIQRSQKMEKIKAGTLIELNLETFTEILKSAWSFFAAFQATYNKGEK